MNKINVVVKKEFLDRYTGQKHKVGDKLVVTGARLLEIKRSGAYVEVQKEAKPEKAKG